MNTSNTCFWFTLELLYTDAEKTTYCNSFTREELISFLMSNDSNGIYSDESSIKEFGQIATKEDLIESVIRLTEY